MKKIALALPLCASSFAGTVHAGDFNIGLGLGYGSNHEKVRNATTAFKASSRGLVGGVFVSYNRAVLEGSNPFIVGFELGLDLSGVSGKDQLPNIVEKTKQKYSLQGVITLGTKFGHAKTDLRLGYSYSRFEFGVTESVKKSKGGLLIGLGVSEKITDKLSLGLTYDYTLFSQVNVNLGGDNLKIKSNIGVAKLRLLYTF